MRLFYIRFLYVLNFLFMSGFVNASPLGCFKLQPFFDEWTSSIAITNQCGEAVDLQNAVLEFNANQRLSGSFWGEFGTLAYPETTEIISKQGIDGYQIKMPFKFSKDGKEWHPKTTLDNGETITIKFASKATLQATALVFSVMTSPDVGQNHISFERFKNSSNGSHRTGFSPYVDVTLNSITRWDADTNSMQPLGLLEVAKQSGIRSFHLAFVTADNGCHGTWAGYPVSGEDNGFGVPVFRKLKEQGISLTVAFGGLSGQYLAQVCDRKESLSAAYEEVIHAYQPDVLDFDIENNMQTNNEQLDRMMQAILHLKAKYPELKVSFTLPVLPTGLVLGMGENVIQRAAKNGLTDYGVNIMAMDYGPSFQEKSMGAYAIEAANNTFKQLKALYPKQHDDTLWHRIEVTPMIGLNDTQPLNFSLNDVKTLSQFAVKKGMGLVSYWSITRDHPCAQDYVSITCSGSFPNTKRFNQQVDYEYAKMFLAHLN